ncbi:hypothetical protein ACQ4M3_00975 [Leptolyngbya sp. AN03gr2]|uniref:hypothetical protein n=1 Tax=unclassified Leptolyngbya TaxID=2650499 RepID=UPI003D323A3D
MPQVNETTLDPMIFRCFGKALVDTELQKVSYSGNVVFEKGKYTIFGKRNIQAFVDSMSVEIDKLAAEFTDSTSQEEHYEDRAILNAILNNVPY